MVEIVDFPTDKERPALYPLTPTGNHFGTQGFPMENLIEFLEKVRHREYPNETAVRSQIVQPILERLGWPVDDAGIVHHEYSLRHKNSSLRVNMALWVSPAKPRCIMELKGPNHVQGNDQLFEYAFHVGAPLALLTNGCHWRLYYFQARNI